MKKRVFPLICAMLMCFSTFLIAVPTVADMFKGLHSFELFLVYGFSCFMFFPLVGICLAALCKRYKINLWVTSVIYSIGWLFSGFLTFFEGYERDRNSISITAMTLQGYIILSLMVSVPFVLMQLGLALVLATGKAERKEKIGFKQYIFYIAYPIIALVIAAVVGKFRYSGAEWMIYVMAMAFCMAAVCAAYAWSRGFGMIHGLIAFVVSDLLTVLCIWILLSIYYPENSISILPLTAFIALFAIVSYAAPMGIFALFGWRKTTENVGIEVVQ